MAATAAKLVKVRKGVIIVVCRVIACLLPYCFLIAPDHVCPGRDFTGFAGARLSAIDGKWPLEF
jgi:hypothetical protein